MSSLLRLLSIACSLVLVISFGMFASDQADTGKKQTVAQLNAEDGPATLPAEPAAPEKKKHGPVRTAIENVNEKLVGPFDGIVKGDSPWTQHIVQSLLAFLVFGLGLGFLSRYAAGRGI